MPLLLGFFKDVNGFRSKNGGMLAPKSHLKSILSRNSVKAEKHYNPHMKIIILEVLDGQNRPKIHKNINEK